MLWLVPFVVYLLGKYLPTGYIKMSPGPVQSLRDVVSVEGVAPELPSIQMVTILARNAFLYDLVASFFDSAATLVPKEALLGGQTEEQYESQNAALMEDSINTAIEVALLEAGYVWAAGDPLPVNVSIAPGGVIGPSAGLAFALEVYLRLRAVDFAQDSNARNSVVATGVLSVGGTVGPVGGVSQKTLAALGSGADVFILPRANLLEALENAGALTVRSVGSFKEAVSFLLERP